MIYPSIEDLTMGKYNRYTLVVATAKCARIVTDEYVQQREHAEKLIANKETEKSLASMIKKEYRDEKAVKNAINRIYAGEFRIVEPSEEDIKAAAASDVKNPSSELSISFPEADNDDDEIKIDDEDAEEEDDDSLYSKNTETESASESDDNN